MPIDTTVTLPPVDSLARGLRPSAKKTLFDMYSVRGGQVPIYVAGEGQSIDDSREVLMRYEGEAFGVNAIVDRYMYHWEFIYGMYITVSVKGECS